MNIDTISTKELREDFNKVRLTMAKGQPLLLLYRSTPIAKISPMKVKNIKESKAETLRRVEKIAGSFDLKLPSPKQMNEAYDKDVYGG